MPDFQTTLVQLVAAAASTAAQPAMRTGAIVNGRPIAATRNSSEPLGVHNLSPAHSTHLSKAKTEGTMANALDREAHIQARHIPLRDREHAR